MKSEKLSKKNLIQESDDYLLRKEILPGEIEGVDIEFFIIKGSSMISEAGSENYYDIILSLDGDLFIEMERKKYKAGSPYIVRMPYNKDYLVYNNGNEQVAFLRLRKSLDVHDRNLIFKNIKEHSDIFIKALVDCPVYTEEIKSSKSLNRILLPEGKVPRLCIGYVETSGPDTVAEHEHPMLDQLFLGMKECNCICKADDSSELLRENMILHIPLGSKHSVTVEENCKLAYIWLDFFLTIEGQKYIRTQHQMEEE